MKGEGSAASNVAEFMHDSFKTLVNVRARACTGGATTRISVKERFAAVSGPRQAWMKRVR